MFPGWGTEKQCCTCHGKADVLSGRLFCFFYVFLDDFPDDYRDRAAACPGEGFKITLCVGIDADVNAVQTAFGCGLCVHGHHLHVPHSSTCVPQFQASPEKKWGKGLRPLQRGRERSPPSSVTAPSLHAFRWRPRCLRRAAPLPRHTRCLRSAPLSSLPAARANLKPIRVGGRDACRCPATPSALSAPARPPSFPLCSGRGYCV